MSELQPTNRAEDPKNRAKSRHTKPSFFIVSLSKHYPRGRTADLCSQGRYNFPPQPRVVYSGDVIYVWERTCQEAEKLGRGNPWLTGYGPSILVGTEASGRADDRPGQASLAPPTMGVEGQTPLPRMSRPRNTQRRQSSLAETFAVCPQTAHYFPTESCRAPWQFLEERPF